MGFARTGVAHIAAVLLTTVLVSAIATQINLSSLEDIGADISFAVRVSTTISDLAQFGPLLGGILLFGLTIAFAVAAAIIGRLPSLRNFGYTLAGFATIIAVLQAITFFFALQFDSGITPIPASRTMFGLLAMAFGGAAGGYFFARMTMR